MKYSNNLKGLNNLNPIDAMNVVLDSYSVEKKTSLPIKDLVTFVKCIKRRKYTYQYPFHDCPISKLYVPTLIKSIAHAFLIVGQYTVSELLHDEKFTRIAKKEFGLYVEEFNEFWQKCSENVRDYVEKCAQFYVDSFYACCMKEIPISSIFAKWVGTKKVELIYNKTLKEHYLKFL